MSITTASEKAVKEENLIQGDMNTGRSTEVMATSRERSVISHDYHVLSMYHVLSPKLHTLKYIFELI